MLPPLPDALKSLLDGYAREPVVTGLSSARVDRYTAAGRPALFLKTGPLVGPDPVHDEIVRLEWMSGRDLPVPRIVTHMIHDATHYLVMEELPGTDASVERPAESRRALVRALAVALRRLHETPVDACPFPHPAALRVEDAARRVASGFVNPQEFDSTRRTRDPEILLQELVEAHERLSARRLSGDAPAEEAVFTHGDYCLPNVILLDFAGENGRDDVSEIRLSGFIDVGRAGVADRYQDLALAARSLAFNLGSAWVPAFFEDYGLDAVDPERIAFYTLLDEFF